MWCGFYRYLWYPYSFCQNNVSITQKHYVQAFLNIYCININSYEAPLWFLNSHEKYVWLLYLGICCVCWMIILTVRLSHSRTLKRVLRLQPTLDQETTLSRCFICYVNAYKLLSVCLWDWPFPSSTVIIWFVQFWVDWQCYFALLDPTI